MRERLFSKEKYEMSPKAHTDKDKDSRFRPTLDSFKTSFQGWALAAEPRQR